MKVVYSTCCGADAHKTFFVAIIIKTTKGVQPSYQKKRFSTFNSDIWHFKQWLLDNSCFDVCMESADKKKSMRTTRVGVYLKPALVQCAHAAIKSTTTPHYKNKCERLAKRRGKKRAIIAIARIILTAVYQMLSTWETWNPCNLYKTDMPQKMQDKQKVKAVKQALKLLISEGMILYEFALTAV